MLSKNGINLIKNMAILGVVIIGKVIQAVNHTVMFVVHVSSNTMLILDKMLEMN